MIEHEIIFQYWNRIPNIIVTEWANTIIVNADICDIKDFNCQGIYPCLFLSNNTFKYKLEDISMNEWAPRKDSLKHTKILFLKNFQNIINDVDTINLKMTWRFLNEDCLLKFKLMM